MKTEKWIIIALLILLVVEFTVNTSMVKSKDYTIAMKEQTIEEQQDKYIDLLDYSISLVDDKTKLKILTYAEKQNRIEKKHQENFKIKQAKY